MGKIFKDVKEMAEEAGLTIVDENAQEELIVVENEEAGIKNLVIDCEDPIVVFEQRIMKIVPDVDFFKRLLQVNRLLVHGAFVLDEETGEMLSWFVNLQLENLDFNELEGAVNALSLAMAEYAEFLLENQAK
ncbi:molecular chaperone Tir [Desulfobacterales bacterium HSG17]|nr:molecular chaperone Tir [Desulfobacterales bacterium HSG17]